ncbi:MAG: PAS domain-containing protein [Spirochaetes bacterium]|nr:PAS domain-containing protein [Spirochaetota bacterium]MBU1081505.1 PAS domain-containing protein [Spirochaetota bacterium]
MTDVNQSESRRMAGFDALLDAMIAGGDAGAVRAAEALIADARPQDLVNAVDTAVAKGVDSALLKPAVSRLVNLLSSPLSRHRCSPPPGERLFSSLVAENAGLLATLERCKPLAKAINDPGLTPEALLGAATGLRALVGELGSIEIHYKKKENVLFPWFESRYPQYRCVRLMWEIQDDARLGLKELAALLDGAIGAIGATAVPSEPPVPSETPAPGGALFERGPVNRAIGRLFFDLNANALREELALYPVMMALMAPSDGERLFGQTREYGYAFLDDAAISRLESGAAFPAAGRSGRVAAGGLSGRTGALPSAVLSAMFSTLPVDMTYVDGNDKVRWFSDSPSRIFPRSPEILGRDVRNCHPGRSVGRVVAILDSFRRGEKEREAFWISMKGRFIHIEYFALRGPDGAYLGVLEASQDLTELRSLTGEKRLAD